MNMLNNIRRIDRHRMIIEPIKLRIDREFNAAISIDDKNANDLDRIRKNSLKNILLSSIEGMFWSKFDEKKTIRPDIPRVVRFFFFHIAWDR